MDDSCKWHKQKRVWIIQAICVWKADALISYVRVKPSEKVSADKLTNQNN